MVHPGRGGRGCFRLGVIGNAIVRREQHRDVVGTVAGVLIASSSGLSPMLAGAAMSVLAAIVLGGLDSVVGAIVASLAVGLIEALAAGYLGGKTRDIVPYIVVLAVLVVKPHGLFGTRTIERL